MEGRKEQVARWWREEMRCGCGGDGGGCVEAQSGLKEGRKESKNEENKYG